jgi:hypothetical protein
MVTGKMNRRFDANFPYVPLNQQPQACFIVVDICYHQVDNLNVQAQALGFSRVPPHDVIAAHPRTVPLVSF